MRSYVSHAIAKVSRTPANFTRPLQTFGRADLFHDLYDITGMPRSWQRFLASVCELFDASWGTIAKCRSDVEAGHVLALYARTESLDTGRFDPLHSMNSRHPLTLPELFSAFAERLAVEQVLSITLESAERRDLSSNLEVRHLLVGRTIGDRDWPVYIAIGREPHQPVFSTADEELMAALLPHLRQAMHLANLVDQLSVDARVSAAMLDLIPIGVLVIDQGGRCMTMNELARQTVRADDLLLRQISGRLPKQHGDDSRTKGSAPEPAVINLVKRGTDQPLAAIVWDVPAEPDQGHRVVFIIDGEQTQQAEVALEILEGLYGLTSAEARVAALIAKNNSPADIAERLGTTMHTIRTHLRHIFAKTGTERQIDLVHLLLRISVALRRPPTPAQT